MPTANVNGVALEYRENGSGEPVVMVHGALSDYRIWQVQREALGRKYRAISYSLRYQWPSAPAPPDADQSFALIRLGKLGQRGQEIGCRIGETFALQWLDVDLPSRNRSHPTQLIRLSMASAAEGRSVECDGRELVRQISSAGVAGWLVGNVDHHVAEDHVHPAGIGKTTGHRGVDPDLYLLVHGKIHRFVHPRHPQRLHALAVDNARELENGWHSLYQMHLGHGAGSGPPHVHALVGRWGS